MCAFVGFWWISSSGPNDPSQLSKESATLLMAHSKLYDVRMGKITHFMPEALLIQKLPQIAIYFSLVAKHIFLYYPTSGCDPKKFQLFQMCLFIYANYVYLNIAPPYLKCMESV